MKLLVIGAGDDPEFLEQPRQDHWRTHVFRGLCCSDSGLRSLDRVALIKRRSSRPRTAY